MDWFLTSALWYTYLLIIGLIFWPVAARLFAPFIDKGYPFAKTIGIIATTYIMYILGIFHVIPFTQESIFFLLILLAFCVYRFFKKEITAIKKLSKKRFLFILCEEILFFVALLALIVMRGQEPSVHGLEKFMDYGFMQSIYKSRYFPPLDMWLSADMIKPNGYAINYYYFGHMTGAFLMKLSGVLPSIGYNFILATIFAQGVTLSFSITANIVYIFQHYIQKRIISPLQIILFGALGSFLVNLAGNLHTIYLLTKGYPNDNPEPFWKIWQSFASINQSMSATGKGFIDTMVANSKYWYPNATRFIPFTIHEFPSYSYVVADLHGHVFDIPFVLLTLALVMVFFLHISKEIYVIDDHWTLKSWFEKLFHKKHSITQFVEYHFHITSFELAMSILFGFMIAIHYMTNAFDGPIYFLLLVWIFFFFYRISLKFIVMSALTGISYILFALPFSVFFSPFVSGVGVNCSPEFLVNMKKIGPFLFEKGNCQVSAPWMLLVLWGFFWLSSLLLVIMLFLSSKKKNNITPMDQLVIIIFAFGTFLIIIPEFFYIKDIYPAHFRANTMFKLGYQAFMMMAIASSYVLFRLGTWQEKKKYILQGIYAVLFLFVFVYPFLAFPSYYPGLYLKETYQKAPIIDGAEWLTNQYPAHKEIIEYINNNIQGQPVILEAQGDSYTDYNLISAYTGTPTIAGWWVHEWLWRGSSSIVGDRIPDIINIYESKDIPQTKYLLNKYSVEYVVISKMEKDKYPNLQVDKFNKIGTRIFESNDGLGALYKVY